MDNLFVLLKNNISEQIAKLEQESSKFDVEELTEFYEKMHNLSDSILTDSISFELLESIWDKLVFPDTLSKEKYLNCIKTYQYFLNNNANNRYSSTLADLKPYIEDTRMVLNNYTSLLENSIAGKNLEKNNVLNQIYLLQDLINIIENFESKKYLTTEELNVFLRSLIEFDFGISSEDKMELIKFITKSNVETMSSKIKLEQAKAVRRDKQPKNKKDKVKSTIIEKIDVLDDDKSLTDEELRTILGENNDDLYIYAKRVFNTDVILTDYIKIPIHNLEFAKTMEERKMIYLSLADLLDELAVIKWDIKTNLLPKFESSRDDDDLKNLIEAINLYKQIYEKNYNSKEENIDIDFASILENLSLDKVKEMYLSYDEVVSLCEQMKEENERVYYESEIMLNQVELEETKKGLEESIKEYAITRDTDDLDILLSYAKDFMESYIALNKKYNYYLNNTPESNENLLRYALDFYNGFTDTKNIFIFLGDEESQVSNFEEQMLKNSSFKDKDFASIQNRLRFMSNDSLKSNGDHRIKTTSYSEEFLRKFHVKSYIAGMHRFIYSSFTTTLDTIMDIPPCQIVFLISVNYGSLNNNKKASEYLKICYDNQQKIEEIRDLFNTDWSKLSESEANEKRDLIQTILEENNVKLGHLIRTCQLKIKGSDLEEGEKYGSY